MIATGVLGTSSGFYISPDSNNNRELKSHVFNPTICWTPREVVERLHQILVVSKRFRKNYYRFGASREPYIWRGYFILIFKSPVYEGEPCCVFRFFVVITYYKMLQSVVLESFTRKKGNPLGGKNL